MIKPQHFASLAVAALVSVILAFGVHAYYNTYSAPPTARGPLVPGLLESVNAVSSVELTQGEKKLTLVREGTKWTVKERNNFPVDPKKAGMLVVQLAQAQLMEPRTQSKERHAILEVEDPALPGGKSRRVRLLDGKGGVLADVVVGKSKWGAFGPDRHGVHARRSSEAQAWLVSGDPRPSLDVKDWVIATILEMDATKISRVTIEPAGEAAVKLEKGDEKNAAFKIAEVPAGKKLKAGVTLDAIAAAFSSFELEDLRQLTSSPGGAGVSLMKVEGKDIPTTTFRFRKEGEAVWVSFEATGEGEAARKAADAINARAKGWEFQLPRWKVDAILKRHADLFEPAT